MKNIAFVFPGHGSQYLGMGESLCKKFPIAQETYYEAQKVCKYDLLKYFKNVSYKKLINDKMTLAALLTLNVAIFRVFKDQIDINARYYAGYSFGELTALVCAKSISFNDALKISLHKGLAMEKVASQIESAMATIEGVDYRKIEKECKKLSTKNKFINIAVFNSKDNLVVSGSLELVGRLENILQKNNIKINRLEIDTPFHSPYFKQASIQSKKYIKKFEIKTSVIPVVSSLSASVLKNKNDIIDSLSKHFVRPVLWSETIDYLAKNEIETIIEVGPKRILTNEIKKKNIIKNIFSFSSANDLQTIKNNLILGKEEILDIMSRCMGEAMSVRNSNENDSDYEKKVIKPYQKIKNALNNYRSTGKNPTKKDLIDSFLMLKCVLKGKMINRREAENIFQSLYNENKKLSYIYGLDNIWKRKM